MSFHLNLRDRPQPLHYKPSAFRSALAISPATLSDAREADAMMAQDGWAYEDHYPSTEIGGTADARAFWSAAASASAAAR